MHHVSVSQIIGEKDLPPGRGRLGFGFTVEEPLRARGADGLYEPISTLNLGIGVNSPSSSSSSAPLGSPGCLAARCLCTPCFVAK
jgi:hypothetical protein